MGRTIVGRVAAAGLCAALAATMTGVPAAADPPPSDYRILAGVGSGLTANVMNGLAAAIDDGTVVASWDGTGPSPIKTKASSPCTFPRPSNPFAGKDALRASEGEDAGSGPGIYQGVNVVGCVDFARVSPYLGTIPPSGSLKYVAFGVDAVALAKNVDADLPNNISFNQVRSIYHCALNNIGGVPVTPRLLEASSDTWLYFLQQIGITEFGIQSGIYPCLATGNPATPVHPRIRPGDGTALNGNLAHVMPFSVASFIAQSRTATILSATGVTVPDQRGQAFLTGLSSFEQPYDRSTLALNLNYRLRHDVFNAIPSANLSDAEIDDTFTDADADVCTAAVTNGGTTYNVIELFGFGRRTVHMPPYDNACGYGP